MSVLLDRLSTSVKDSKIIQQERSLTYLETEKASYILCFQNIEEEREEDLRAIITQLLIPIVGLAAEEINQSFDNAWRSLTIYTRNNCKLREIQVFGKVKIIKY